MQMRSFALALLILATLCVGSFQQCASQAQLDLAKRLVPGADLKKIEATKLALAKDQLCAASFEANGGTCCDYESLKAFANQLIATLKQQFAGIDSVIASFPSILESLPKLLEHLTLKDPTTNSDPQFIEAIGGQTAYYKYLAILQHLTTQSKAISEDITGKKFDTGSCLKSIFNQKLSVLCLVCSPVASKFFNDSTQKFIFKKAGIQAVLTSCIATFDVFNKVTHALQAFRLINKALSSKDAAATAPPADFSLEKMLKYEECRKNPEQFSSDNAKLLSMGSELGGATKPPVVATRAAENIASVPDIKASAATGFKDAMEREKVKLQAIQTEKVALAAQFSPTTAGSPPQVLAAQITELDALETLRAKYATAVTTLSTSTSTPTQITAANQDLLGFALSSKRAIAAYAKLQGVVERFVSAAKDELTRTTDSAKAAGFVTNQQDGLGLLEKYKQATSISTELDSVTASVQAAGSSVSLELNEKYRRLLQKKSEIDTVCKGATANLRTAIETLFTAVQNRIKAEADAAQRNIDLSANRALAVEKQKELEAKRPEFEAAQKQLEVAKAKLAALNGVKTRLSGNLPVTAELTNASGEWTARNSGLSKLVTDGEAVKTAATTATSSTGLPQSIGAFRTFLADETAKINARITAINTRLSGTDSTATALSSAVTTTAASIETLKAEITAQEAIIAAKQASIATLKASLPPLQTDLFTKFGALQESFGKINLQLAQIADYKGKVKALEADYAARTASLTAEKDSVTKIQTEKCSSSATNVDATYCSGLVTKISTLTTAISEVPAQQAAALAPLNAEIVKLDSSIVALRTAHAPIQSAHDTALGKVKEVDTGIRAALDAINAALVLISDKKRQIIAKETESQVQNTSTSSFNSDIKLKIDEELKLQKGELEGLLATVQKISAIIVDCVSRASVAPITSNLAVYDGLINELKQRRLSFETRIQAFLTFKTATEAKIQSQITQVTADIATATTDQTAAQSVFDTAKAAFDGLKAQLDNLMKVPPPPAPVRRILRRVLQISDESQDFEFSETNGADTATQFSAGVEVDTNLASTSTFTGATDPTKLDTQPAASGNFSQITKLCSIAFLALAMLI